MANLKRYGLLLIMLLSFMAGAYGASVRLRVDMPRGQRSIGMGDQFYITMEVSDIDKTPDRPSNIPGAKLLYFERTGQSSRFSSVNGKTSQSFSYTYTLTLRAAKEGHFTYGPVSVDGVSSNSVSYDIGKATARDDRNSGQQQNSSSAAPDVSAQDSGKPKYIGKGDGNLFLKANISKTTAYEQEALVYTVKLYTTYDAVKFIGATAAPKFEGFVVEESKDISTQLNYETYNGKTYATAIIARYIIFPQMAGTLKVLGNTYTISVDEREYYHDPFWGSMSYRTPLQLNVSPNDLAVKVNSLPLPKPADFSGGVGEFRITSTLPESKFLSNQAASIVYNVSGTGNIKYVTLPDLNVLYPDEIEVYSPTTDVKVNVGSTSVSGNVKFDYSFMPLEVGTFEIPDVKLVYFNPSTGRYETSVARGYKINVEQGKNSAKSQTKGNLKFDSKLMEGSGNLSKDHRPWIYGFAYWLWFIIPAVILLAAIVMRGIYEKNHADMAAFNSRRADKIARRRLRRAAACMKRNDTDHFYDEMLNALWGYLGDKLKMPMSVLMRDNIVQVLTEKSVPEQDIEGMVKLLDECDFAKYAPSAPGLGMKDIYSKAINIINSFEQSFKNRK